MDGWVGGWMDGYRWMDEWMDGCMDGWMSQCSQFRFDTLVTTERFDYKVFNFGNILP